MKQYTAYIIEIADDHKTQWRVVYFDYTQNAGVEIFDSKQEADAAKLEWEQNNAKSNS